MSNFRTKARTVELLGRKQIRDSVTAIAELMKNSYDADASSLRVEFNTKGSSHRVVIADNGMGMNQSDIESKWLVLGTNSKTYSRTRKTPSGRPLMGAKGIGRLASSAVGRQLWMFSKTKDSLWNIVFLHWSLFENPNIAMHEISIPTRFNISTDELLLRFDSIKDAMISELLANLENAVWTNAPESEQVVISNLRTLIDSDARSSCISLQAVEKFIRSYTQGTILFIDQLYDNWDKYLIPTPTEARLDDPMSEKMYNRFSSFVSTLRNAYSPNLPFSLEIYHNGNFWENNYEFLEEDYQYYDIKVQGVIEHGIFTGSLDARNAKQDLLITCNEALKRGIRLTSGIPNWESVDCGRFSIKFCHIEGMQNRSGLSPDDYNRVKRKLELSCGISVYRDGVRILPYGEPENDFLSIEARRTEKAGRYIFSHRNIFGRIDIDSDNNPNLEDKSSREGLIENAYYYYFVKVLENLLITIALDYLSSVRKDSLGIQASFVENNKLLLEEAKVKQELEKREKAEVKKLRDQIKNWQSSIVSQEKQLSQKVEQFIANSSASLDTLSVQDGYNNIHIWLDQIESCSQRLIAEIMKIRSQKMAIPQPIQHYFSEDDQIILEKLNAEVTLYCDNQQDLLNNSVNLFRHKVNLLLTQWINDVTSMVHTTPDDINESIRRRLSSVLDEYSSILDEIKDESLQNRAELSVELKTVEAYLHEIRNSDDIRHFAEWRHAQDLLQQTASLRSSVESIFSKAPEEVAKKVSGIFEQIEHLSSELSTTTMKLRHSDSEKLAQQIAIGSRLTSVFSNSEADVSDEQIISFLRQEVVRLNAQVEIYSDLANMGLAAEIVNHEFNQLFINVNNAIRNLAPYVKDQSGRYWLRQIDMGFRSISDRQNQLSPMYRSYSLRKAKTNLHDFIEEIRRFTEAELKRNNVTLQNEVPDSVYITISKSKFFPAISNLINNAIYWTLDCPNRVIQVRFDSERHVMYIEDSGRGIVATDKETIFEPFVSYKPNGRGLGLTVARKVLASQGHKLEIADEDEKGLPGACFKIIFSDDSIGE